jgi:hypothetical protein
MRTPARCLLAVVAGILLFNATAATAATGPTVSQATFEGKAIDLTHGWGEAHACAVIDGNARCFRAEAQMDAWLAQNAVGLTTLLSDCWSSVRLYSDGGFGGDVLYLSYEAGWLDLYLWGFDNVMSSFKIGACDSYFTDYTQGGGAWYPGSTTAWTETSVVAAGWNDRVSSVWIT